MTLAFWVLPTRLSAPILVQWVPYPCFPLFHYYFYKNLSLYIHIPNIYLELGFEFGPQENRDLAFVCPLFVLWEYSQSSDIHEVVKGKSRDFVPAWLGNYIRNVITYFDLAILILRMLNEAFFHWNPALLDMGRQFGQIDSEGILGIFSQNYQHPFRYSESLVHVFHYSTIISTKN